MGNPAQNPTELAALGVVLGEPVAAVERCAWGFTNQTSIVTLVSTRRVVVQFLTQRARAAQAIYLARELPLLMSAVGVRAPQLLVADSTANPPYIVREYLPGEPANQLLGTDAGAIQLANEMGAILPLLARVPTGAIELDQIWAYPKLLAEAAQSQLDACSPLLDLPVAEHIADLIRVVKSSVFVEPTFAHGDFCPVNALLEDGHIVALLDLELARLADRLFDLAWWGWVVRYHHPQRWAVAWPYLLAAAGVTPDPATLQHIWDLQMLRCLEMLDTARQQSVQAATMWAERLTITYGWNYSREHIS